MAARLPASSRPVANTSALTTRAAPSTSTTVNSVSAWANSTSAARKAKAFRSAFTATLTVGDTARLVHATEPGGTSSWQTIQQSYLSPKRRTAGPRHCLRRRHFRHATGPRSDRKHQQRQLLAQFRLPVRHSALSCRISRHRSHHAQTALLGAGVNGWNNIADDNDGKTAIFQLTWKPSSTFTGILGFIGGSEGTGAYGPGLAPKNQAASIPTYMRRRASGRRLPLSNCPASWIMARDRAMCRAAQAQRHVSGTWLEPGGLCALSVQPRLAIAGRIEQFDDNAGAGGMGLRTGGTGYNRLREGTVTLEYTFLRSHLVTRLEYRHDASNQSFFGAGGGTAPRSGHRLRQRRLQILSSIG